MACWRVGIFCAKLCQACRRTHKKKDLDKSEINVFFSVVTLVVVLFAIGMRTNDLRDKLVTNTC